jgi:DNA polymerase III subunit epsilon
MDFVAIDVETANPDRSSICQIGIATFLNGELVDCWESLVAPAGEFSPFNISIHGIDRRRVRTAPSWNEIYPHVASRLESRIVVSHTSFDRHALTQACACCGLSICECQWLDSAEIARTAWPQFSRSGYKLTNLASHFGFEYRAHDALEDAKCAGWVVLKAIAEAKISPGHWLRKESEPIRTGRSTPSRWKAFSPSVKQLGNASGALFGEVIVFTGALTIAREAAAEAAAMAGCRVDDGVTKRTTLLVVGNQDLDCLRGHEKSSKHLKAEKLITQGQRLRILSESEFLSLIRRP